MEIGSSENLPDTKPPTSESRVFLVQEWETPSENCRTRGGQMQLRRGKSYLIELFEATSGAGKSIEPGFGEVWYFECLAGIRVRHKGRGVSLRLPRGRASVIGTSQTVRF